MSCYGNIRKHPSKLVVLDKRTDTELYLHAYFSEFIPV